MASQRNTRLVVFEDNPADAALVEEACAECGYSCQLVFSASHEDAVAKIASERFDLLLTDFGIDVEMATMFLRSVRALAPAMPIIVLSGMPDSTPAYIAGANAFIHKDADLECYFSKIRSLMSFWTQVAELPRPISNVSGVAAGHSNRL